MLIQPRSVDANAFWNCQKNIPVVDVRSPSEFTRGHVPGAFHLPLFSDAEREQVGLTYNRDGRDQAVDLGLQFVGPKLPDLIAQARQFALNQKILVHCWRGGMRSQSLANVMCTAGLDPILLSGGYKAFRRLVHARFERPWKIQVLSGLTGVGKTKILNWLRDEGCQVIDLEGLAHHRGSAFGGFSQPEQPTTEQFENNLFVQLSEMDVSQPVWVEDEGCRIGQVVVPNTFHRRIQRSPAVFLETRKELRISSLVDDYGNLSPAQLKSGIDKIAKRLGGLAHKTAIEAVDCGHLEKATEIALSYYDRAYNKGLESLPRTCSRTLDINSLDRRAIVDTLKAMTFE